MAAFEQGAALGSQIVQQGFDQYWQTKRFREMLSERAQDRSERQAAARSAADYRSAELGYRAKTEADTAAYRTSELEERKARDKAEQEHWRAMEGRGGGRGPGSEMTRAQAASAAHAIDTTFTKKDAPALSKELFDQRERFRQMADPTYKPQTYQAPKPSWWQAHAPSFMGGAPTAETGSGLPGLE